MKADFTGKPSPADSSSAGNPVDSRQLFCHCIDVQEREGCLIPRRYDAPTLEKFNVSALRAVFTAPDVQELRWIFLQMHRRFPSVVGGEDHHPELAEMLPESAEGTSVNSTCFFAKS